MLFSHHDTILCVGDGGSYAVVYSSRNHFIAARKRTKEGWAATTSCHCLFCVKALPVADCLPIYSSYKTVCSLCYCTALESSRTKLLLEWDASPVNDMLADSMVALAAQAQTR